MSTARNVKIGLQMVRAALGANILGRRKPVNVMFGVTNRCPSRCTYCQIPERPQADLSTEQIFDLFRQMKKAGTRRLGLWGGEPLMRKDIGQLVDFAKECGFYVSLDSNGYLLPKKIDQILNLDHLVISLDGRKENHDANRQPGSFDKALAGIKAAAGRVPLWTITVLTRHNLGDIDYIVGLAREHGFLASFQLLHHSELMGRNREKLLPEHFEYKAAIEKLIALKKAGAPIVSTIPYLEHVRGWNDYGKPQSTEAAGRLKCRAGELFCNIDVDGRVFPCSLLIDGVEAENFLDVGFEQAFRNLPRPDCKSCNASCYTEYNLLYALRPRSMVQWGMSVLRAWRLRGDGKDQR
jgi:MoaA/NifB/PqqE/SkfB family radical SAM enzyme